MGRVWAVANWKRISSNLRGDSTKKSKDNIKPWLNNKLQWELGERNCHEKQNK